MGRLMAKISKSKVTVFVDLTKYKGYDDLSPTNKSIAKREAGEVVIDGILDNLGSAKTPVSGGRYKSSLSSEYRERKGDGLGSPIANLELTGAMLDSLTFQSKTGGIEVGIFDSSQAPKAYNHQRGDTLPTRQFLPESGQKFKRNIESELKSLIKELGGKDEGVLE
jgi:hypothetical protein